MKRIILKNWDSTCNFSFKDELGLHGSEDIWGGKNGVSENVETEVYWGLWQIVETTMLCSWGTCW